MRRKLVKTVVRSVGAVLVLLSVFLVWFAQVSLYQYASLFLAAPGGIPVQQQALFIIFGTLILVVVGALVSFLRSIGGVLTIVGVIVFVGGLSIFVPSQILFGLLGIGLVVAIVGAVVVLAAGAIPEWRETNLHR